LTLQAQPNKKYSSKTPQFEPQTLAL